MNAKFFDLNQEKQDRMINAILKIFAINGYQHASTDDIVKEARISKGLLFHYFESKLGAYSFAYDYCVRYLSLELSSAIDPGESSYFEVRRQIEAARMQALKTYPYMGMFMNMCDRETVLEAIRELEDAKANFEKTMTTILAQTDLKLIKANASGPAYLEMLDYTLNGIMEKSLRESSFNAEMNYAESVKYIAIAEKALAD